MGVEDLIGKKHEVELDIHEISELDDIIDIAEKLDIGKDYEVFFDLGQRWDKDRENAEPSSKDNLFHVSKAKGLFNENQRRKAAVASEDYEITQHHEVLDKVYGGLKETKCGSIKGQIRDYGEVIFGEIRFTEFDLEVEEEPVNLGMRFGNSFDTTLSVFTELYGYRERCSNGMLIGKTEFTSMKRRHVNRLGIAEVKETVKDIFKEKEDMVKLINAAKDEPVTLEEGNVILSEVGFGRKYRSKILERMKENTEELNRWLTYNAATSVIEDKKEEVKEKTRERHHEKANNILSKPKEELVEV